MKIMAVLFFSAGVVFLFWTYTLMMRGRPFLVHVGPWLLTLLPRYMLLTALALLVAGCVSAFAPPP